MLKFTILNNKVVVDPNIILLSDLNKLYKHGTRGERLLQVIYYTHSRDVDNPFRDLDQITVEENVVSAVFKKKSMDELKLTTTEKELFRLAEKTYLKYNMTSESRLEKAIDKKLDEISTLLNDTMPVIEESVTKNGEVKFTSNLNIILNLFTKIETIMKSKTVLQNAIRKQEGGGRVKGGGSTSFREMGILS